MLSTPLNVAILRALADGPKRQVDLRRAGGSPAQTTLRAHLNELVDVEVIVRHRQNRFPGVLEFELTETGRDLLSVITTVEAWLARAPTGALELAAGDAQTAIKALAEGWSARMLRALAAGPISLNELDRVIGALSYPSLERRIAAMRVTGQIEARPGNGHGTPYAVTAWMRRGVAPLAAAIRWERRHRPDATAPLARIDSEATLLLAVPLLRLPPDISGACRLAVDLRSGGAGRPAGVIVAVEEGRIASCATSLEGTVDAWICGSPQAWLAALMETDTDWLELGGEGHLAHSLLDGLHRALFATRMRL